MAPKGANRGPETRNRMLRVGGRDLVPLKALVPMSLTKAQRTQRIESEEQMFKKIAQFFKESYAELRKVVWPGKDDVISSVAVVIISTVIIAAILGLVDFLLLLGVQAIF
jgi:preprotein translocase subunit SecE